MPLFFLSSVPACVQSFYELSYFYDQQIPCPMQSPASSCPPASSSTHHCALIGTCRGDGEGQSLGEGLDIPERGGMVRGGNRGGFLLLLMLVTVLLLGRKMPFFLFGPLATMSKVSYVEASDQLGKHSQSISCPIQEKTSWQLP